MAIIKITGTKQGETVQLCKVKDKVRTPISNTITGYPYNFKYNIGELNGQPTRQIQMHIAYNGKSHLFDMGHSSVAKGIINSLGSVTDPVKDELFEFSFYQNKKGYNSVSIKRLLGDGADDGLPWSIGTEEQAKLIVRATKKDGTKTVDSFEYDEAIKAICERLATLFPKSSAAGQQGGNGLDELDDDNLLSVQDADDVFAEPAEETPKEKPNKIKDEIHIEDLPF